MKNSAGTNNQSLVIAITDEPTSNYCPGMEPVDAATLEEAYSRSQIEEKSVEEEKNKTQSVPFHLFQGDLLAGSVNILLLKNNLYG